MRAFAAQLPAQLRPIANMVLYGTPYAEPWQAAWIRNPDHYFILKPGLVDALQFGSPQVRFHVSTLELWPGGGIGFRTRPVDYFVDAVVVGDSFGFCFTEREDCWVTRLEAQTGQGLVNLSLPGTGSRSHTLVLRDFGQPLAPPLVIWQFFGNDFNDDYGLARARGEADPADPAEAAAQAAPAHTPDMGLLMWLRQRSVLVALLHAVLVDERAYLTPEARQFEERYETQLPSGERLRFGQPYEPQAMDMTRPANQAGFAISRAALSEARDLVAGWGGRMVIVLLPTREEVYDGYTAAAMGDELAALRGARLAMQELCADLALMCYDALADLQAAAVTQGLLYYADDMHLNPAGNRVLARSLHRWLMAQELLPS